MFRQVYSSKLDSSTTWYALTTENCISTPRKFSLSSFFQVFPDEVVKIRLSELYTADGGPVPSSWFFSSNFTKARVDEVFVATAFGIIGGLFSRKQITEVKSIISIKIQRAIRTIDLIDYEADFPPRILSPPNSKCDEITDKSSSTASSSSDVIYSDQSFEDIQNSDVTDCVKRRKIRKKSSCIMDKIVDICTTHKETLGSVLAQCCLNDSKNKPSISRETISKVIDEVSEKKGVKRAFDELISDDAWDQRVSEVRVPDWQCLLLKLETKMSDASWQSVINTTRLGRKGMSNLSILPIKNHMKALRAVVFGAVRGIMEIKEIPDPVVNGFQVNLQQAIVWSVREQRLHGCSQGGVVEFLLKLDGRPLFGKDQVTIGIIPKVHPYLSDQSALAVHTLGIANIEENRESIKAMVKDLNKQKDCVKRNGINVDGKLYQIKFKVVLDYKDFCLLLPKKKDANFMLGGKGFGEFCMFCHALRLCAECGLGPNEVCMEHFAMTKANIGGFKGVRDDLTLLLDEEMMSVNICALHCEMRNMEQLLASLGLFCWEVGSLDECNAVLKEFGPQNMKQKRISVKAKPGQETKMEKHNVQVASFSGSTARKFLQNATTIVERSLPLPKLHTYYKNAEAAKMFILNKITFFQERILHFKALKDSGKFVRDFGSHQEEVIVKGPVLLQSVGQKIDDLLKFWESKLEDTSAKFHEAMKQGSTATKTSRKSRRKNSVQEENEALSMLAAQLALECYLKVFSGWKDIALTMRKKVFKDDEDYLIDIFDIECKEWGFMLKEVFGLKLGTGDYGHMAIEHASMLLRNHRSIGAMSNQGFEASHKVHRQLYLKATSHDVSEDISSLDQILTHQYAERFLFLRLSFRKALQCLAKGTAFHFPGCHWPLQLGSLQKKLWTKEDIEWIKEMDVLMTSIFGADYPRYVYQKQQELNGKIRNGSCIVKAEDIPSYRYLHSQWEDAYLKKQDCNSGASPPQVPGSNSQQQGSSSPPQSTSRPRSSTSPPQGSSSPSQVSVTPPQSTSRPCSSTSPPQGSSSPSQVSVTPPQSTSRPRSSTSPPQGSSSPSQVSVTPPQSTSRPRSSTSPPQGSSSPSQSTSRPRSSTSPPQGSSSPSQVSVTPPQSTSPPQGSSSPSQVSVTPPQSTSRPRSSTSPPQGSSSPSQVSVTPPQSTSRPSSSTSPRQGSPSPRQVSVSPPQSTSRPRSSTSPPQGSSSPPQSTSPPCGSISSLQGSISPARSEDSFLEFVPGLPRYTSTPAKSTLTSFKSQQQSSSDLINLMYTNPGLSRGQLASIDVPEVIYVDVNNIQLLTKVHADAFKDPFSLLHRPSEAVVEKTLKMLREHANSGLVIGDNDQSDAVRLGALGIFSAEALDVLKAFCLAAEVKDKVRQEISWLSNHGDDEEIRKTLLALRPSEEFLNIDDHLMDAKDFSNLACERYIDGYTIDITCTHFLKKSKHRTNIVYLPSHTFTWATADYEFLFKKLEPIIKLQPVDTVKKVICPVHVGGCHWGILCIDVSQDIIYYDDGMHMQPPNNISLVVKQLMKVLKSLFPLPSKLMTFDKLQFQRCGMPRQPNSGEGSSSCGIGVMYAVKDIVQYSGPGIPIFHWSFHESSKMRKTIMKELISERVASISSSP